MASKRKKKTVPSETRTAPEAPQLTSSGNDGLDIILGGGFPRGRVMLATGGAGCGKTIFGLQFIINGAQDLDEPGVFVSFEETAEDLVTNAASFRWDLRALVDAGKVAVGYMDLNPANTITSGAYDLGALMLRIERLIDRVKAKRIVVDGISNLLAAFENEDVVRNELLRLFRWLKDKGLTVFATGERGNGGFSRLGFEEYLADGLMVLENRIDGKLSKRSLRIVKCRGVAHGSNDYAFLIGRDGPKVYPIDAVGLDYPVSRERISVGVAGLDEMLRGKGVYRGSTVLIGGTAGTGKSTVAASFARAACERNERSLYFTFEEAPGQLFRNMKSVGIDLKKWDRQGLFSFKSLRALQNGSEGHLTEIQDAVDNFGADVVVIDPVSSLSSVADEYEIRGLLARLIDFLRARNVTTLMTNLGSFNENHLMGNLAISSLADTWIVLSSVEQNIERNYVAQVIKSRGMSHSNELREYKFTKQGIDVLDAYLHPDGIVIGSARIAAETRAETQRLAEETQIDKRFRELERRRRALDAEIQALNDKFDAERASVETEWQAHQRKYDVQTAAIERIRKARLGK